MTTILKNQLVTDFLIVGLILPGSGQLDVTNELQSDLLVDPVLLPNVDSGDIVVNDGTSDLSAVRGRRHIEASGVASTTETTSIGVLSVFDDTGGTTITDAPASIDGTTGELSLSGQTSGTASIKPSATAGNITLTLPDSIIDGGFLKTDASGVLSFENPANVNQNLFETIAVSGQSNVVADSPTDILTLVAGTGITITTDASTDTITITNGSPSNPSIEEDDITIVSCVDH